MAVNWKAFRSGVGWIVFSPVALLMALISTVESDVVYNIQLAAFGTWSACGIVSGVGRLLGASWAVRLQIVLCWLVFAAFALPGVVLIAYAFRDPADWLFAMAAGVCLTGVPFLIYAVRRQRELRTSGRVSAQP
jgi:hypothetical protein